MIRAGQAMCGTGIDTGDVILLDGWETHPWILEQPADFAQWVSHGPMCRILPGQHLPQQLIDHTTQIQKPPVPA